MPPAPEENISPVDQNMRINQHADVHKDALNLHLGAQIDIQPFLVAVNLQVHRVNVT